MEERFDSLENSIIDLESEVTSLKNRLEITNNLLGTTTAKMQKLINAIESLEDSMNSR